jgi:hypothetical protein
MAELSTVERLAQMSVQKVTVSRRYRLHYNYTPYLWAWSREEPTSSKEITRTGATMLVGKTDLKLLFVLCQCSAA